VNPRTVLQERYPSADLWEYFRFLGECAGTLPEGEAHEHHICPKKQFPEYAEGFPENLITLRIEDHAFAHKLLGAAVTELRIGTEWIATNTQENMSAAKKAGWTPEARARSSVAQKLSHNRPEVKAKAAAATERSFKDPVRKAKHGAQQKIVQNRPEVKALKSAALIRCWKDPEWRERVLDTRRRRRAEKMAA